MGYKTLNCPVSRKCGGCEWLDVPYPIQLKRKQQFVQDAFDSIGCKTKISPIDGMDEPTRCRNKIIVPFAPGKSGGLKYGLYAKGTHKIIDKPDCIVEDEKAAPILESIAKLAHQFKIPAYNEDSAKSFLRYVQIRTAHATGQVLVTLVCAGDTFKSGKNFCHALREEHPEIDTIVMNINKRRSNAVLGDREMIMFGRGFIEDELCGCTFRISSSSFYQVNPIQTQKLYSYAIDFANLDGSQTILDTYCGTGTIGIIAASKAKRLIGVEMNGAAVKDARSNARTNKIRNAEFVVEDSGRFMDEISRGSGPVDRSDVDVVFMDPPRSGADERFLKSLSAMGPKRVVYVSCDVTTQVRDIAVLVKSGYRVDTVQPVDMFPHTKHVETVASLTRRKG